MHQRRQCTGTAKPDGTSCTDSNVCTLTSACHAGSCSLFTANDCYTGYVAYDTSTCDPSSGCAAQLSCPAYDVQADGSPELCRPLTGRDPATGYCFFTPVLCSPGPASCNGEQCRTIEDAAGQRSAQCVPVPNPACNPDNCEATDPGFVCPQEDGCTAQYCNPFTGSACGVLSYRNCQVAAGDSCLTATAVGSPLSPGCNPDGDDGYGHKGACEYSVTSPSSAQPNGPPPPCQRYVADGKAAGCLRLAPIECTAADFGMSAAQAQGYTFSCDSSTSRCVATPK